MNLKIKQYAKDIQQMTQTEYAETQAMMTIHGVGHITALTFVLTLGDKTHHQGRQRYLRSLLIECANHILRPHDRDSALRQWGLHLAARGGKQAKNKSVVAVAHKLAVLLHHLWTTQQPYVPFYQLAA